MTPLRPNGEILLQQDVIMDEFGTWTFHFPLPDGEEDITGIYRLQLSLPSNPLPVAERKIPCEVFRRNAFRAEWKLDVPKIEPRQFTAELHAVDWNGTPLSNAEVRVSIHSDGPGISLQETGTPQSTLTTTLRTDAHGKVGLQGYIAGDFPAKAQGESWLSICGSIINDRQEVLEAGEASECFYSADFRADFDDIDRIRLHPTIDEEEAYYLPREQKIRVRILGSVKEIRRFSDCISLITTNEQCLFDREFTVPSHCENGIQLPLQELYRQAEESDPLCILISGTDAKGRSYNGKFFHFFDADSLNEEQDEDEFAVDINSSVQEGTLHVEVDAPAAGEALVLIQSRRGTRVVPTHVKGGEETISLPLLPEETGTLICRYLQIGPAEDNLYHTLNIGWDERHVPRP